MQRKIVFVFAAAALLGGAALASEAQAGPYMRDGGGRPGATGPVINYKYRPFNQPIDRRDRSFQSSRDRARTMIETDRRVGAQFGSQ